MEALISIVVQLISGVVGGNVAGIMKSLSLGSTGNSIAGGIGGLVLGQLMNYLQTGGATDMTSALLGQAAGSGVAGIVVTAVIGLLRNVMAKR